MGISHNNPLSALEHIYYYYMHEPESQCIYTHQNTGGGVTVDSKRMFTKSFTEHVSISDQ